MNRNALYPKNPWAFQDDDHPGLTVVVADSFQVRFFYRGDVQKPPWGAHPKELIEGSDILL